MKLARRISQILFLTAFLALFFLTIGQVDWSGGGEMQVRTGVPADIFLRLDPLAGLTSMLSARSFLLPVFLWALPVLVLTLIFGRAFCGWVCPLGTCIDASDHVLREKRNRRTNRETSYPRVKYYLLGGLVITAILGAQLVWLFDPIPLLFRSLTIAVFGPLQWLITSISGIPILGPLIAGFSAPVFPETQSHYRAGAAALLLLGLIFAGGVISRRFWCRSFCPLGALLGLLSRIPLFRRRTLPACNNCTLCELDCKMDAIGLKGAANNSSECIYCYSCVTGCSRNAAAIGPGRPPQGLGLELSRRHVLAGLGLGALWGLSTRSGMADRPVRDGTANLTSPLLIRPPGAVAERTFRERCIRCGECMKVCPTNGLQPAMLEAGLAGLWTPVLFPRAGECAHKCNLCAGVCPTQAILPFTLEEKEHLFIGRAAIDRSRCVVWESGKDCLVCDEVCSYDAIFWQKEGGIKRPFVDIARCVGCGICENNCPVGGPSAAIRIYSDGDKRSWPRQRQKEWRQANLVDHPEPPPGAE